MAKYIDIEKIEYPYMTMSMWGINSEDCHSYNEGVKAVEDRISAMPAADVVEVVRCMYCKRSEKRNGNRYCTYWQDTVDPMHYCGKGDRKEPL